MEWCDDIALTPINELIGLVPWCIDANYIQMDKFEVKDNSDSKIVFRWSLGRYALEPLLGESEGKEITSLELEYLRTPAGVTITGTLEVMLSDVIVGRIDCFTKHDYSKASFLSMLDNKPYKPSSVFSKPKN